jgi:hypothetical protein
MPEKVKKMLRLMKRMIKRCRYKKEVLTKKHRDEVDQDIK